jgi:transcriptional regulator with XRE-family HTH domain
MADKNQIGERIRAAREALGMSQRELGEAIRASKQAVSFWELGKYLPGDEYWAPLAEHLQVPVAFLTIGVGKGPAPPPPDDNRRMTTLRLQVLIRQGRLDGLFMPRLSALIDSGALDDLLERKGFVRR